MAASIHHAAVALVAACLLLGIPVAVYVAHGGRLTGNALRAANSKPNPSAADVLLDQLRGPAGRDRQRALALHASLGHIYRDSGDYVQAAQHFHEARELAMDVGKEGQLVEFQAELGVAHLLQGKAAQAKQELEAGRILSDKANPKSSWLLHMLGNANRDLGKIDEALRLYAEATELPRDEADGRASLLNDIGRAYMVRGALDEAMANFREALRQPASADGDPRFSNAAATERANSLSLIGGVMHARGDAAAALEYYRRALRSQQAVLHKGHPYTLATRASIARAQRDLGDAAGAEKTIREAEALMGDRRDGLEMAALLQTKGDLLREAGKLSEGEATIREGLHILQSLGDQSTPDLASMLNALGSVIHDQHRYHEALSYYHQALRTTIESSGRDSPEAAAAHNNIGNLYQDIGDDKRAQVEFTRTLEIQLKSLGPENPDLGASYNNLGTVAFRRGQVEAAERLLAKAIDVADKAKVPGGSPDRQIYVENHQAVLEELRSRARKAAGAKSPAHAVAPATPPPAALGPATVESPAEKAPGSNVVVLA